MRAALVILILLLIGGASHGRTATTERIPSTAKGQAVETLENIFTQIQGGEEDVRALYRIQKAGRVTAAGFGQSAGYHSGGGNEGATAAPFDGSRLEGEQQSSETIARGQDSAHASCEECEVLVPDCKHSDIACDYLVALGAFKITAYTAGYESTGKRPGDPEYGITFSGAKVQEEHTIAADWDVLPEGTRVYIEDVGIRVVEDKGGAIQGKIIDLYIPNLDDALDWGRQERKVYVIEWGN